jgi:hypothetical protein
MGKGPRPETAINHRIQAFIALRQALPLAGVSSIEADIRVPYQVGQVLTAGAANSSKPILDRPFSRAGPSPDGFDGLMGGTKLAFQSVGDGHRERSKILDVWKNYALFRQHPADPPRLW